MDIQLHYTETGTGEPLVLLHGNGEDSSYFVHQIAFFSAHRRVLAVDTRGHGKSPRGSAPFTIRQFAEDLLAFLDERGIERTDLLGFSDGANIALVFALRHPGRVRRLILNGANLDPAGVKRSVQIPIELGYRVASLFAKKSAGAKQHAELLGLMVNDPMIPAEELGKVTAPTLVIAGTKDMIREKHTRAIADALPNAKLVFLPGDHFIANKNPEAFNRAVEGFLAETEG
ncbi:MAG: alpha/beta fold hydrolase [Oscillospiraceae bacterium]